MAHVLCAFWLWVLLQSGNNIVVAHRVSVVSLCVFLHYSQEARNIEEFGRNFANDPTVKIPWVRRDLCGSQVVVMEWIEGIRCTDIAGIHSSGTDIDEFIR